MSIGRGASVFVGAAFVVALGAALWVSRAEEEDSFCARCHLRPERTYVGRATAARAGRAVDLAAAHAAAGISCVGCHRGDQSLPQRGLALTLGAWNAVRTPFIPADIPQHPVRWPHLPEAGCWFCHIREPQRGGVEPGAPNPVTLEAFENHFHTDLLRADLRTSVRCVDCHRAHQESLEPFFAIREIVIPACERCHREVGRGPIRMGP
ncbi:hypothetical protein [Thermoflexus sp.]|uniref:hypothetical protein n=1 Tax=Thermoflexus sp. TaxID=1969742 RepID=UPI0025EBBBBE|nr:hypothetical protein [Thermoflexus sp.]MCS6964280.1 hypothetical protein [Thermoflexus sp.]MCX7689289.1 hypothetical protein [Thermoflexus sp.]MDW8185885.1 hypothetical protein [Anaerolineae bacterium]